MVTEMAAKLKRSLVKHEERRKFPYTDTLGNVTFGIGYNASARGMSDSWIDNQYDLDVQNLYTQFSNDFKWFQELTVDRQIVLIDMAFMGYEKILKFEKMLACLAQGKYEMAAQEMIDSEWAKQVKSRATDLAEGMKTGIYDI